MKNILIIILIVLYKNGFSQTVSVDIATQTPVSLVNTLIGNSCIEVSNISISSAQSVGYFNRNNSSFPINEGIIIRNGNAKFSEGSYTGTNLDSQVNSNNDATLQALVAAQGQTGNITDVAFLEFDFIPLSNNFSFNFLFASNEYGQYQCASFDTFAFLLTDLTTNITTNLAVISGTNTPVSVLNIRDNAYNSGCTSSNSQLFSTYNVTNAAASTLNMRGFTTVMNASSLVIPNNPYRIRLVIGDYVDHRFDSAVFLSAGSFITTIDLGEDAAICMGNTQTITTGLDDTIYSHVWTRNGVLLSETSNSLIITEPGTYNVTVTTNTSNCTISDEIIFYELSVNPPVDLFDCFNTNGASHNYNLTLNNEITLGIDDALFDLFYYNSLQNVTSNTYIDNASAANYNSPGNETIYIKIFNTQSNTFCDAIYEFDLLIDIPITIAPTNILSICTNNSPTIVNLESHFVTSNPSLSNSFTLNYYTSQNNAIQDTNALDNALNYTINNSTTSTTTQTIWIRVENIQNDTCFEISSFDVSINPLPLVDILNSPIIECSEFILPPITNGNYFEGPNGTGNAYFEGDIIDELGTYYIFNGPDANGCTNESSFQVFIIEDYTVPLEHCGEFSVPTPLVGSFYTAAGGPNGTGTLLLPGTPLTTSQSIYYYAEYESVVCIDVEFPITIYPLPVVDVLDDVVECVSYTLQPLINGNYKFPLTVGSIITETQTIEIVSEPDTNGCTNNSSFTVFIINEPLDIDECGSYILPALSVGNYYLEPGGSTNPNNTLVPQLTEISAIGTSTFYIFVETSSSPNCTYNYSFKVNIKPRPVVDELPSVVRCDFYSLPQLTNGNYFALSGGPNTPGQISYSAGQIIDLTGQNAPPGTYYIYVEQNQFNCDNESSFEVIINPLPVTPEVSDFSSCQPYSLPNPVAGNYYTEPDGPNGTGTLVSASTIYTETKTFYLYSQDPNTLCFVDKPFTVFYNAIELPDLSANECGSYTLPNLTFQPSFPNDFEINYYSQPGGNPADIIDPSDYTFSTPGTYTIYVYASNGDRFFACTEEKSFTINISETPILTPFDDIESCGSYTLPYFPASNFNINYYNQTNSVGLITPNNYTFSTPGTYDIYVYVENPNNPDCNDEEHFVLTIYPLLNLNVDDEIICVDPITRDPTGTVTLQSGLNPNFFEVNWFFNNQLVFTGPNYTTNQSGIYTIETTKLTPEVGANCNFDVTTAQVFESSSAIATLYQSSDFDEVANLTIEITNGLGTYEFALDNGPYQTSNIFNNVSSGEHIISVRDIYGNCDPIFLETIVLKYPKYFTPNGDGNNETWNIWDMRTDFPDALITIFDRYGKLIKQFSPATFGWDGTLNGYDLPASDYWFVANYKRNGKEIMFKSHFSLKR